MASLTLYGSAVADTTLTTACKMAATSGGVETSKTTTIATTSLTIAEVLAQGGASTPVSTIPTTPTGNGWVYNPGAGAFATGNWSAFATMSLSFTANTLTMRFFRYSAGVYTSIGSISFGTLTTDIALAKTTYTFAATSMGTITFGASDLLYVDLWLTDTSANVGGDNPVNYCSTTATAGVANDMAVTTSSFTPAVALAATLAGAATLSPSLTIGGSLIATLAGVGVVSGPLGANLTLAALSLTGVGTLTGLLSLPNLFMTQSGGVLKQGGVTVRSGGTNIYWLGLYQDQFAIRFPYTSEIDDALATAAEMGCLFVRSHTLGISVGNSLSIETSLNTFNDANFVAMDYAIKRAGDLGLKLIIPLTDFQNFYEGGEATFTGWRSLSPQTLFYTNATVIADFEAYINHLLNHVNTYNGLAYKNDPTILCWETGNEIYDAPASWTSTIASYIKSIDANHLIMCGSGLNLTASATNTANLALSTLDIFTDHFYPPVNSTMAADAAQAVAAGKAYIVGEYNWTQFNQAAATFGVDATTAATGGGSNSAVVNVTSATPGDSGNVQLQQGSLTLVNGSTYTAKFWAKADANRNVDIVVQQGSAPFTVYLQQTIAITTTWTLYTASTFVGVTDTNAYFTFNCSDSTGHIWFDLCSLGTGGGNILLNPSFESSPTVLTSWANQVKSGDTLTTFITAVEGNANISGSAFWDLKSHAPNYGYSWSSDPYRMEYPGETADLRTRGQQIRTDSYTLRGLAVPAALIPAAPVLTSVAGYVVAWQGAVGAYLYDIERSVTNGTSGFSVVVSQAITDTQTPWTDPAPPGVPTWYRVKGYSYTGTAGAYSNVLQTNLTPLSLYGTSMAAGTPATAGKSATTTGGYEVAAVTTAPASGSGYVECFALGGISTVNAALPAPSGKGWTLDSTVLEGQRLIAGNWTASVAVSDANGGGPVNNYTLRFWQRSSGGTYAAIGSLALSASQVISTLRVLKTFAATAMPQTDFAVGDKLYIDFFINANGWASDVLSVYVSNSGVAGVASDMEVDTAGYIPSGASGVVTSYIPRALSALLVVTSTALLDTLSGTGTLSGIVTLSTRLSITLPGGATVSGQLSAAFTLSGASLAGSSTLVGTASLSTTLASSLVGTGTLAGSGQLTTALAGTLACAGSFTSAFTLSTALILTTAGVGILTPTLGAAFTLPGVSTAGAGTLTGTLTLGTAFTLTLSGLGQVVGTLQAATAVAFTLTLSGVGTLSAGAFQFTTALASTTAGAGTLSVALTAAETLSGGTCVGNGTLSGTLALRTQLAAQLAGIGISTSTLTASFVLGSASLAGVGTLAGTENLTTALADSMSGVSSLVGSLTLRTPLSITLAATGALAGAISGGGALAVVGAGVGTVTGSLAAALSMSGTTVGGISVLTGTLSAKGALTSTFVGVGSSTAMLSLGALWSATLTGTGTLNGTSVLATYLLVLVPGASSLTGTVTRTAMLIVVYTGGGHLNAALILGGGQLSMCILAGHGTLAAVFSYPGKSPTATWKTRDHSATWQTRDLAAIWKTRDLEDTWKETR